MIDYEDMYLLLKEAIEDRPNFTYPTKEPHSPWYTESGMCRYTLEDGTPGCIIGWVMHRLNLQQHIVEGQGANSLMERINKWTPTFSAEAIDLAESVQYWQDDLIPWDRALAKSGCQR